VRHFPFSCFVRPDSFLAVPRATGLVFMFCAPRLVFGRNVGVGSRFHVLRGRTHVQRKRGCRVSFSSFALPESFPTVPRASCPVFKFCALGLIFGGIAGIRSRFQVFRYRTRFRCYLGRRLPFSCFARSDSFSAIPRASGPVFKFCASGLIFGCTVGVRSCFHVLLSRTCFRRYRGRWVPFSCFALPDSFSVELMTSGLVYMFCVP
jgi:hypothetical protein